MIILKTHAHTHVHPCMHAHTHARTHTHMHARTHTHTRTHINELCCLNPLKKARKHCCWLTRYWLFSFLAASSCFSTSRNRWTVSSCFFSACFFWPSAVSSRMICNSTREVSHIHEGSGSFARLKHCEQNCTPQALS